MGFLRHYLIHNLPICHLIIFDMKPILNLSMLGQSGAKLLFLKPIFSPFSLSYLITMI